MRSGIHDKLTVRFRGLRLNRKLTVLNNFELTLAMNFPGYKRS